MAALRVGLIGASATGGWARDSHVPAVRGSSGLTLEAVATHSQRTADEAASAFGIGKAYGNGLDLIQDPEIELVTIATRVPDHRDLVLAALAAGKHVYCEWPLGRSVAEAGEMADEVRAAGVHAAIGLQLRASPVARRARTLLADGAIGRVLSLSVFSATAGYGQDVAAPFLYLEDPANFANLVTIQGAHTIDLALVLVGPLEHLSALATAQYPEITSGEHGSRTRSTFDHLLVQARSVDGASLAIEVAGGRPPDTPFRLEAVGDRGVLRIEGGAPRGVQTGRLQLFLDGIEQTIDDGELAGMPDAAFNVAAVYAALRDDIVHGTATAVGFDHAVCLTRMVEDVFESSRKGRRCHANAWPA